MAVFNVVFGIGGTDKYNSIKPFHAASFPGVIIALH